MANVKLGENIYKNVHSVGMTTESGDSVTFPKYVIGTPMEIVLSLSNWSGTTYSIKIENYKIGNYGVQIGMPAVADVETAQMIVECALTIPYSSFTSATSSANAYTTVNVSAIKTPTKNLPIVLFGLEAV